ncbi:MAG TPA: glycosyltransferase, partial [Acidobacteria bacterium]|nr:glycosyltransferase [Acidobacteriota bacterium]
AYGRAILLTQTEERIVHAFAHQRPWWWYLQLLPLLTFPYSLWPPLWRALGALRPGRLDPGERFCLAWLLPGLAVFSAISGKQPHYLLPLCPAFALLAARRLEEGPEVRRTDLILPLAVPALVGLALLVGPSLAGRIPLPTWAPELAPGIGALLLLAAAAVLAGFRRMFPGRPAAPTLITLAFVLALHAGFAEVARRAYDLGPTAHFLALAEKEGRPVAVVGGYHGQFHFLGRLTQPFVLLEGGAAHAWLLAHPRGRVVEDLRYVPPGAGRVLFSQPYRDDTLVVWGLVEPAPDPG